MRNLLNPKWVFALNTLPAAILVSLFLGEYQVIKTLLDEKTIGLWGDFGIGLAGLTSVFFFYALSLVLKKKPLPTAYAVAGLLSYIPFLYLYAWNSEEILPSNIPRWMIPNDMAMYAGAFLMPMLAHSFFILLARLTQSPEGRSPLKSFAIALALPAAWYLFGQVLIPLWQPIGDGFNIHVLIVLVICSALVFLFFLGRVFYILAAKKAGLLQKYRLAWLAPVAIVMPLAALALNNGYFFDYFGLRGGGLFGDFDGFWFYALAIFNGLLLCLPDSENKVYRLLLFAGRSIGFSYIFYFFVVMLPFLPLSVMAVAFFGLGFLLLTPVILFVIHLSALSSDAGFLSGHFSKWLVRLVCVAGFLVLPACLTYVYLEDRRVLNETLAYLYQPDYLKNRRIDEFSLKKTLASVKANKSSRSELFMGGQLPYLSSYFNWLVLDNMTLPESKINLIESVFFGESPARAEEPLPDRFGGDSVKITKTESQSRYDAQKGAWISQVDLEITNRNSANGLAEYSDTLELPAGCWISGYHLFVGDKKEPGILSEKKTAMWVFSQIQNQNRDPGLLHYLTGNRVAFKVFPFGLAETRKTGIEFLHKEPFDLHIGGDTIMLGGGPTQNAPAVAPPENPDVLYISAQDKARLATTLRTPYFHFLLDVSKGKESSQENLAARIKRLLEKSPAGKNGAKISFVNAYHRVYPLESAWADTARRVFEGGYYLDRAIKSVLTEAYLHPNDSFPILVAVTDDMSGAVLDKDFSDFNAAFPERDIFYVLEADDLLYARSLTGNPVFALPDSVGLRTAAAVLPYPNLKNPTAYLPDDGKPSILLKNKIFKTEESDISVKNWYSALQMQGQWESQTFFPDSAGASWLDLVRFSFKSQVMSPVTAYLVVENEAQKAALKRKQEQVLSGNPLLDIGEDTQRMSEPGLAIMAALLGGLWWWRGRRGKTRLV